MPRDDAPPADATPAAGWRAELDLEFQRRADTTVLAACRHHGPLRVQKALYPEGAATAHAIVLHPPGGVAGGDTLDIRVAAAPGAQALLTTPGAGKWYRAAGRRAAQSLRIEVAAGACVEWLPQETIVFAGTDAALSTQVELAGDARFLGLEILCFGRTAAGEKFDRGALAMRTQIRRDGRLLWHENARLAGGTDWLTAAPGLAGQPVAATLLLASPEIAGAAGGALPTEIAALLATCRDLPAIPGTRTAITALPGLFVARCLCTEAEQARRWFLAAWAILRPALLDRPARTPRIWNT